MVDRSGQPDECNSSKAQIRTLLEEQRQTILADCNARVSHHELQAAQAEEERRLLQGQTTSTLDMVTCLLLSPKLTPFCWRIGQTRGKRGVGSQNPINRCAAIAHSKRALFGINIPSDVGVREREFRKSIENRWWKDETYRLRAQKKGITVETVKQCASLHQPLSLEREKTGEQTYGTLRTTIVMELIQFR